MRLNRREFLAASGAAALAALDAAARSRLACARGLLTDPRLEEVVGRALSAARKAGATYADVRVVRRRGESVATREDHILDVGMRESYGLGVRVIVGGACGFA